jgi:hypothetical protein
MAKTIKVSGTIDRTLHAEVKGVAAREGVAFGVIVTTAIERFCNEVKRRPGILKRLPRDGRMTA